LNLNAIAPAILVVDDQPVVRRLTFRILSQAGFRVHEAGSASEALEVLSREGLRIRLVIIDVVMADVDGIELSHLVLKQNTNQSILFMSAHPAQVMVQHGLDHPIVHFLAKPFTHEQLLNKVNEALDRRLVPRSRGSADRLRDS
jgi:two-component system cell cycle sensor histidine kinase/response regulator CckA